MTTTMSAVMEYLAGASNPSPLAQLAREALMRELNRLQVLILSTPALVAARRAGDRPAPAPTCVHCGAAIDADNQPRDVFPIATIAHEPARTLPLRLRFDHVSGAPADLCRLCFDYMLAAAEALRQQADTQEPEP